MASQGSPRCLRCPPLKNPQSLVPGPHLMQVQVLQYGRLGPNQNHNSLSRNLKCPLHSDLDPPRWTIVDWASDDRFEPPEAATPQSGQKLGTRREALKRGQYLKQGLLSGSVLVSRSVSVGTTTWTSTAPNLGQSAQKSGLNMVLGSRQYVPQTV